MPKAKTQPKSDASAAPGRVVVAGQRRPAGNAAGAPLLGVGPDPSTPVVGTVAALPGGSPPLRDPISSQAGSGLAP
jgi:hypothetical protein